ncbi:MAG: FixH family protein [Gammaproteobacteria bacterium]|nr:FixH family protein [Gammaproteobacteria bacterium]
MTGDNTQRHWSREPYVWLVISFPAAAVIAGIITIILAVKSDDGLVVDDYYKRGLEINRTLDRDRMAQEYRLEAGIVYPAADGNMHVQLVSKTEHVLPDIIDFKLLHATRKGFDRSFSLARSDNGKYRIPVSTLEPGRWHILIETEDWRLVKVFRVQ